MFLLFRGTNIAVRTVRREQLVFSPKQFKFVSTTRTSCSIYNLALLRNFAMDVSCCVGVPLAEVVSKLNEFAPVSLAEPWDNVGLLIEPFTERNITKILLTNDLTEPVMQEALQKKVEMIISYHPPIFSPLKSISKKTWKERIVAACLENGIALYSPHTSFDSVKGGVNDWLASIFDVDSVSPLSPSWSSVGSSSYMAELIYQGEENSGSLVAEEILKTSQAVGDNSHCFVQRIDSLPSGEMKMTMKLTPSQLPKFFNFFQIPESTKVKVPDCGAGRMCHLKSPCSVAAIVEMVKKHIKIPNLRLALAVGKDKDSPVSTIALCAGSGSSVLRNVKADLYLTGEMSHHEVLDAVHKGSHVILCEHSNSERGFLVHFADILGSNLLCGRVQVVVSSVDADPLIVV